MAFQNYLQDEDRFSAYTRIDSTKSPFKDQTVPDYVRNAPKLGLTDYLETDKSEVEGGTLTDFLGATLTGGIEGLSFGTIRLGEDPEKMNTAQRMGAGLGNALSMVVPIGPFAALGRAANWGVRGLASAGSKAVVKKAVSETGKKFAQKGLSKDFIEKNVKDVLVNNKSAQQQILRHGVSDAEMQIANQLIKKNVATGLKTALRNAGKTDIDDRIVKEISDNVANELRKPGRHINTIEDWVESGLGYVGLKGMPAKYMGMAAQDVMVFTGHQAISTALGAMFHGDSIEREFMWDQAKLNTLQAGLFPAARLIPWGGKATLSQGFGLFKSKAALGKGLAKSNYRKMAKTENGQRNVRGLLHMLTKGADNNVQNVSVFSGRNWKGISGKTYSPNDILLQSDNMPLDDVISILEQYQKVTGQAWKAWGKEYTKDFIASIPRMIAGTAIMNIDLLRDGAFDHMSTPELLQHMAIGAFMTKSRGLWGRDDAPSQWSKDFRNYQDTFNYLNMDAANLTSMVDLYSGHRRVGDMHNNTTRQTKAGSAIYDLINPGDQNRLNQQISDHTETVKEVGHEMMETVENAVNLANQMHLADTTPYDYIPIDAKALSADRIKQIHEGLKNVKVGDASFVDQSMFDVTNTLMTELGTANEIYYFRMIENIAKEADLPIYVETDGVTGEYTGKIGFDSFFLDSNTDYSLDGRHQHTLNQFADLLKIFEQFGIAKPVFDLNTAPQFEVIGKGDDMKLVKKGGDQEKNIAEIINRNAEEYMGQIVRNIHGDNAAHRIDNFFGTYKNAYLEQILLGRQAKNLDTAFRLANNKPVSKEIDAGRAESESEFINMAQMMFRVNDIHSNIKGGTAVPHANKMISKAPKIVPDDQTKFDNQGDQSKASSQLEIDKAQRRVNMIFDFMKAGYSGKVAPSDVTNTITLSEAEALLSVKSNLDFVVPKAGFGNIDFNTNLTEYVAKRTLQSRGFNDEDLAIVVAAKDAGLFDMEDRRILNIEEFRQSLKLGGYSEDSAEFGAAMEKYTYVFNRLIRHKAVQTTEGGRPNISEISPLTDIGSIEYVYKVTKRSIAENVGIQIEKLKPLLDNSRKLQQLRDNGIEITKTIETFRNSVKQLAAGGLEYSDNAINVLNKNVNEFVNKIKSQVAGNKELNQVVTDLRNYVNEVTEIYKRREYQNVYDTKIIDNIGSIIETVINNEHEQYSILNRQLSHFASLANNPLTRGRMLRAKDEFMNQLALHLNREDLASMTIDDAIREYTKTYGLEDLNKIIDLVNTAAMSEKQLLLLENQNDEAAKAMKEIINKSAAHNDNDSPIKLIKNNNLMDSDNPNKIDPTLVDLSVKFVGEITTGERNDYIQKNFSNRDKRRIFANGEVNLTEAEAIQVESAIKDQKRETLVAHIQKKMRAKFKKQADYDEAWQSFVVKDFPVIIGHTAAMDKPVKVYSLDEGFTWVEHDVPGRYTLGGINSPLITDMNLDVGQLSETVIVGGRKTTISQAKLTKAQMAELLNKSVHGDKTLKERLRGAEDETAREAIIQEYRDNLDKVDNYAILDMNNGAPIVLPLTQENVNKINTKFEQWAENKVIQLELKDPDAARNLESSIEDARAGATNVEIKMLLMNMDMTNSNALDNLYKSENFRSENRGQLYNKLFQKILKVSNQTVNKNYKYIQDQHLRLMAELEGGDINVRDAADHYMNNKAKILVLKDEQYESIYADSNYKDGHLASNRDLALMELRRIAEDTSLPPIRRKTALQQIRNLENGKQIESMHSSAIDGGVFIIDERARILHGAINGDVNGNGFKNNIAHNEGFGDVSSKGIVVKGYTHKNPYLTENQAIMSNLDGITYVMGESSAKALYGIDANENPIVPYELDGSKTILENLENYNPSNTQGIIEIPFGAIGHGYMAKTGDRVIIPNSLNDFLPKSELSQMRLWQGFEENMSQISQLKGNWEQLSDNAQVLTLMREMENETGYDFNDGGYGYAQVMLKAGMSHHNPDIRQSVLDLFRGKAFDILRRPQTEQGGDSYLISDMMNDHKSTMFLEVERVKEEFVPEGDIVRTAITSLGTMRVATRFGDVSLTNAMGKKAVKSTKDFDLVFEYEGRDIRLRFDPDGTINITDHLLDVYTAKKQANEKNPRIDGQEMDSISDIRKNKKIMAGLKRFNDAIQSVIQSKSIDQSELTYSGILNIIETGQFIARDPQSNNRALKTIKHFDFFKKFTKKYNIGLGSSTIAIPKKSFDVGFNRVKQFLSADFGNHTIINNYDLRVMHQRDFDGDHGYHYLWQPNDVIDWQIKRMGIVEDYAQFERMPYESNPLGMDSQGKVGKIDESVGFTDLKNKIDVNRYAIGETIALKNTINWAQRIGFEFELPDKSKINFSDLSNIDNISKGVDSPEGILARTLANINQNAVDYQQPTAVTDHILDVLLFGDVHSDIKKQMLNEKITFTGVLSDNSIFKSFDQTKTDDIDAKLNRDVAKIMLRTLKKASAVFNNPFNEGGQFKPTDFYIGGVYDDLRTMFKNPNQYIANKLLYINRGDAAAMEAIMRKFYSDDNVNVVTYQEKIKQFFEQGKPPRVRKRFIKIANAGKYEAEMNKVTNKWEAPGYTNVETLMDLDNSGYLIRQIRERQILKDKDYYGDILNVDRKTQLPEIITRTKNLTNRILLYKSYYQDNDVVKKFLSGDDDAFDMPIFDKTDHDKGLSFQNINTRSAAYHIVLKEANSLRRELAKMDGSPYKVNTYDESVLKNKLADLESTLQVLDKLAMKQMVDKNMVIGVSYKRNVSDYSYPSDQTKQIYSYRGEIDPSKLTSLDFSQLDYHGKVVKGETYEQVKGRTYIELKKPLVERYLGDNESIHNIALWKAIKASYNVENITKDREKLDYIYEITAETISKINDDYSFARKKAKEEPHHKNDAWNFAANEDMVVLDQYFRKVGAIDDAGNLLFGENEVGIDAVLNLINPRPVSGNFVSTDMRDLPYVYSSPRLRAAVTKYLIDREVITTIGGEVDMPAKLENIYKAQKQMVDEMRGYKFENEALDHIDSHHRIAAGNSVSDFEYFGKENAEIYQHLYKQYGYIDVAASQVMHSDGTGGVNYTKKTINKKNVKFVSSSKQNNGMGGC
jgi:hypothetical protein